VPTPLRKSKDPDISFVVAAAEKVAARFRPDQLVILESTTYPGSTEELLVPMFEARGARIGVDLFLAFSPERIDPANGKFSLGQIPKVVGGVTSDCSRMAALLYSQIIDRVLEVSCPKVVELVTEALNGRRRCLNGAEILVLGVAYKRGVGDIRESPSLEVIAKLQEKGAQVFYADPYVPSVVLDGNTLKAVDLTDRQLAGADCVVILTDHAEFDYRHIIETASLVVDTRNATWGIPAP